MNILGVKGQSTTRNSQVALLKASASWYYVVFPSGHVKDGHRILRRSYIQAPTKLLAWDPCPFRQPIKLAPALMYVYIYTYYIYMYKDLLTSLLIELCSTEHICIYIYTYVNIYIYIYRGMFLYLASPTTASSDHMPEWESYSGSIIIIVSDS